MTSTARNDRLVAVSDPVAMRYAGSAMNDARLARLSRSERDALRLAADHQNGEIAARLGVSVQTVKSALANARLKLDGAPRHAASRALRDWEARTAPLEGLPATPPFGVHPERGDAIAVTDTPETTASGLPATAWWPLRRAGQRGNDVSLAARLTLIPAIALVLAVGFGMLANGLEVLAGLIERLVHLVR